VVVDRVTKHRAAGFTRPGAAPGDSIILRIAVPMGFKARRKRFAGKPRMDQRLKLMQAMAIAVLENRENLTLGFARRHR
jgi:hypothetical protein